MEWQQTDRGLRYASGWYGSSWAGGPEWVQTHISFLTALPDGTLLTASGWDEAHRENTLYDAEGRIVAGVASTQSRAIGGDDRYVYVRVNRRVHGVSMQGVARYYRDRFYERDDQAPALPYRLRWCEPAPFEGGEGEHQNEVLLVESVPYYGPGRRREEELRTHPEAAEKYRHFRPQITAIVSDGRELFVAESITHHIHVLDVETMRPVRRIPFRYPGAMVVDDAGNLWVIRRPDRSEGLFPGVEWLEQGRYEIVQLSRDGTPTGRTIKEALAPSALAFGGPERRLYVADSHPERLQVLIYDLSGETPRQVGTFGEPGGLYGGARPGLRAPERLDYISGVGVDNAGNLYLSSRGPSGSSLRRYSPQGGLLWERYTATFMNGTAFDPAGDGLVVFAGRGGSNRFELDLNRWPGPLDRWVAVNRHPWRFPHDERSFGAQVRRLPNGRRYLVTHVGAGTLILREEPGSALFAPSLFLAAGQYFGDPDRYPPGNPGKFRLMWRDQNGNGQIEADEYVYTGPHHNVTEWFLDDRGDLWEHHAGRFREYQGLLRHRLQGFDEHGNPLYDFSLESAELFPRPEPFDREEGHQSVKTFYYDANHDRMYLFGFPKEMPQELRNAWAMGSVAVRYDDWTQPTRRLVSVIALPYGTPEEPGQKPDPGHTIRSVAVAGELIFAARTRPAPEGHVWVYDSRDGRFLGVLKPGRVLWGETSLVDIPEGVSAWRRSNGEYLVCVENNWKNLQIVYRIPPQPLLERTAP
ncbi:MAG: hypothetical protein KatS3mg115_1232 [Candidatus Poribacteria bacterium]|nr:MAG: hypothetical protein KatS3mg115_1232 [Candidatus Poribacteria bacterium]